MITQDKLNQFTGDPLHDLLLALKPFVYSDRALTPEDIATGRLVYLTYEAVRPMPLKVMSSLMLSATPVEGSA